MQETTAFINTWLLMEVDTIGCVHLLVLGKVLPPVSIDQALLVSTADFLLQFDLLHAWDEVLDQGNQSRIDIVAIDVLLELLAHLRLEFVSKVLVNDTANHLHDRFPDLVFLLHVESEVLRERLVYLGLDELLK